MENQIDELYLDIDVKMRKGIENRIALLAKSLEKVNKAIKDSGNLKNLQEYVRNLNIIGRASSRAKTKQNQTKNKASDNKKVRQPQTEDIQVESVVYQKNADYKKNADLQQKQVYKTKNALENLNKQTLEVTDSQKKLSAESGRSNKTLAKLIRSVGRIAFYRAIRTGLKLITDSIKDGITNIREFDEDTNRAFSQMSTSMTAINNSFGSLISGFAQKLAPLVTKISDGIANITNRINESQAVLKGESTYMKVLTSDTKEWQEQVEKATGKLLEFDNFLALNNDKKKYTGLVEAEVGMSANEAKGIESSIYGIATAIGVLGTALVSLKIENIINSIKDTRTALLLLDGVLAGSLIYSVSEAIKKFKEGDTAAGTLATTISVGLVGAFVLLNAQMFKTVGIKIVTWFQNLRLQSALATTSLQKLQIASSALFFGITLLVGGIASLADAWSGMTSWGKVVTIFVSLAAAIAAAAAAYYAFHQNWAMAIGVGAMVAGTGLLVGSQLNILKYKDGGMVEKGTTFIAGEAGAEAVHTSARGTGVTNIEQFTQAMLNALNVYGVARGSDVNFKGDVYINGTKAGQLIEGSVYREGVRVGHFNKG